MKANQCKYCKTAAQEIVSLTASLAERDVEVNKLCELVALHTCYTEQLEQENAALREEVKRLNQLKSIGDLTNMLAEARKITGLGSAKQKRRYQNDRPNQRKFSGQYPSPS